MALSRQKQLCSERCRWRLRPSRTGRRGLFLLLLVIASAAFWLSTTSASAHAFLASSDPAENAVLPSAPQVMTLRFTEALEPSYSRAELYDDAGVQVAGVTSTVAADPLTMTLSLPPGLPAGTYALMWRSLSATDGHTAQGYFPFTVGTQANVSIITPPVVSAPTGLLPAWALPATRWLALLALAALVAIWPVWLVVVRPAIAPVWQVGPTLLHRIRRYIAGVMLFAVLANCNVLLAQALTIATPATVPATLWSALTATYAGAWWLVRIALLLLWGAVCLACTWWWPWRRRWSALLALGASIALPLPFAMISHARATPAGQAMAVAVDYVHLLAASLWAGGLLFLVVTLFPTLQALTPAGRRAVLVRALPRFSLLALVAWGAMGLTGLYSAWLQVGNLPALLSTPYGQTLIAKLVLVGLLLLFGACNLLVVTRKLRTASTATSAHAWSRHLVTALVAEVALATLLLGVVGVLLGSPPARQVMQAEANQRRIPLASGPVTGTLTLMPGTVGPNHYRFEWSSAVPAGTVVTLRVALPARQTGELDVPLRRTLDAFEAHGAELALPGDWELQVTVRTPGHPDWVATATVPVTAAPPPSQVPDAPPFFAPPGVAALVILICGLAGIASGVVGPRPLPRRQAVGLGSVALLAGVALLALAQIPAPPAAATDPAAALAALDQGEVARGAALFANNCAACHGAKAQGDGPGGRTLTPPPPDLTAGHALLHADESYRYWITNGIEGTGMPAFGTSLDQGQIRDVITYLRSLQLPALQARDAPGPETCVIAPRTLDSITALTSRPSPGGTPAVAASPGRPADAGTQAAITAVVRQMVACSNARDVLRQMALYSDRLIQRAYPTGPTRLLTLQAQQSLALTQPEYVALLSISDVQVLEDGRVRAHVVVDDPARHSHDPNVTVSTQQAATLFFLREHGEWRIDETRPDAPDSSATPGPGTPAAQENAP
ncbi:MAG: copper resistance protein CopC [Thermomicrobiales bacterium]